MIATARHDMVEVKDEPGSFRHDGVYVLADPWHAVDNEDDLRCTCTLRHQVLRQGTHASRRVAREAQGQGSRRRHDAEGNTDKRLKLGRT